MGRLNKKHNWKARKQPDDIKIDNTSTSKIKVAIETREDEYDASNALVLPSEKRKTKKIIRNKEPTKILSKKQRKRLEKIIEKKKKKLESHEIIESLSKLEPTASELSQFTSIAVAQTRGRKRQMSTDVSQAIKQMNDIADDTETPNSVAGSKRQKRILAAILEKEKRTKTRDDLVAFDPSSESESEEEQTNEPILNEIIEDEIIKTEDVEMETTPIVVINEPTDVKPKIEETPTRPISNIKAVWVPVERKPEIEEARLKLPILAEEQNIMETIQENDVVIVAGETGSGKTTQLPQFLYEAGFTKNGKLIGVTQPRRVAAITMSQRVAEELNLSTDVVSYLIRYEGNVTDKTEIKFMTDGVLLKEVQNDFLLSKYSVIILDEAHERNTYTDILIGLLSRIVPLRKKRNQPLKLIIMSATLRTEDFTENTRLFKTSPPLVKVESRQFPVSVHFSRRTEENYVKEAFRKVSKIHAQLPDGGILVFLTGQQEVNVLVRRLRNAFPYSNTHKSETEAEDEPSNKKKKSKRSMEISLPKIDLDKYSVVPTDDTEVDILEDDDTDEEDLNDVDVPTTRDPLWVLPFYSILPAAKQAKVFKPPPPGCRLCIISTNIAETSLTIPNIKYVVDSGRTKTRLYDKLTGVSTFHVTWCSKSSANQRAGRAGRVGPGHCYRLFSSAVFNDSFQQFAPPEIQEKPVDSLVLQMKAMNIVKVVNFPFPTPPDFLQLRMAEKRLQLLEAIEKPSVADQLNGKLTKLGETMSIFPVTPRYSKMLALSNQHDLLQYVLCLVAALSVPEVLVENDGDKRWAPMRRAWAGVGNSYLLGDAMVLLRAVGAAECSKDALEPFCVKNGLRHKAVVEIRKLRVQLTNQINMNVPGLQLIIDPLMKPPTDTQAKLIRQIMLAGMADQVAHKVNLAEINDPEEKLKWKRAYRCAEMEEPVFIKSTSVLSKDLPEWVVYQEVYETNKLYMRGVTAIEPEWLPLFASGLCNLSEPLTDPPPRYDPVSGKIMASVNGTFGKAAFPLETTEIPLINSIQSYKYFGKFLLQGEIFPKLERFTPSLLSAPSTMTKTWAKLQPRTETLLKALTSRDVNTRDKIVNVWKESPMYLLSAYQAWVPESAHAELASIWPPL